MKTYWAEVRDINDPTQSGQCRVRLYNKQNDEQETPDDKLAWATVMHPITSAATMGVGIIPSGLIVGSRVLVAFMDDDPAEQYPIILGSFGRAQYPSKGGVRTESDEETGMDKLNKSAIAPDNPAGPSALGGSGVV